MTNDEVCGSQGSERDSDNVRMDIVHRTDNVVSIALEVTSDDAAVTNSL